MTGSIEKRGKDSYRLVVFKGYDLDGKSRLEKLDDNIMEYIHYWFEKYYRNGFCDAVELISGCLR